MLQNKNADVGNTLECKMYKWHKIVFNKNSKWWRDWNSLAWNEGSSSDSNFEEV